MGVELNDSLTRRSNQAYIGWLKHYEALYFSLPNLPYSRILPALLGTVEGPAQLVCHDWNPERFLDRPGGRHIQEKHGLDAELLHIASTSRAIQSMLAGELAIAYQDALTGANAPEQRPN